jgi:hypothetical protein
MMIHSGYPKASQAGREHIFLYTNTSTFFRETISDTLVLSLIFLYGNKLGMAVMA